MSFYTRTHGLLGYRPRWYRVLEALALPAMFAVLIAAAQMFGG